MNISAVILAKNEEKNISDCIQSVLWCDEVLVIDDASSDQTAKIAKKLGAHVIPHALNNNFSLQRNFALTKAKSDWILFVDADERVPKELHVEIRKVIENQNASDAYYIKRDDFMWGKLLKHGETANIYLLRLAKRHTGVWVGKVHESWVSEKKAGELQYSLLHYPHVTVSDFLHEINFYSTLRATELFEKNVHTTWIEIIAYPKAKFIQNYIIRQGFLDGIAGLLLAFFMSFHSFLVRGKLWQLWQEN